MAQNLQFLALLTWKCASHHNCMHFLDIESPSNRQKVVRTSLVFLTRSLPHVLGATAACTFSTSQLLKVLREWCVFTSKCASRHNSIHFFISHLPRCLRSRRFSEPTFRPSGPEPQNIGKTQYFATFLPFGPIWSFSSLIFSLLTFSMADLFHLWSSHVWLSPWLSFFLAVRVHLSKMSEVSLLNFLRYLFMYI